MKKAWKVIFYVSIAVIILTVGALISYLYIKDKNAEVYEDLPEQVHNPPVVETEPEPPEEPEEPYVSPIDFDVLWEINPDVYAWIEIPGMDIAYPVLQSATDDSYYLNHTVEREAGLPGSIYTESIHAKDFSDFNTVIYGHNMNNLTMFGSLRSYRDETFLEEHREIVIYTPEAEYHYKIFAAVIYSNAYLPAAFDNNTEEGRQDYIDAISNGVRNMNSHVLDDVEVTTDSHLITLSTCVGDARYRYLVVAALEESET